MAITMTNEEWEKIAIPFLQEFESCELVAYHGAKDHTGLCTCGWGSTGPDVTKGTVWTQEYADKRFADDLRKFGAGVDKLVTVPLSANQKAALVSFAYNCGLHNLEESTLLRKLNAGDYAGCRREFLKWDMSNGVHVAGLLRRRKAEQELFDK